MPLVSSLDTNILMRYIWNDVPSQCAKVKKLLADSSQTFRISDMVIAEVVHNLQSWKIRRSSIAGVVRDIFTIPSVLPNKYITETVLPFYESHPALSFVDCYAAFEAEKAQAEPLYTFDRKLVAQHASAKLL